MHPALSFADKNNPDMVKRIRKNEFTANAAMRLIVKKNVKFEANVAIENVANTVGILAAQLIRDVSEIDKEMSEAVADMLKLHIENAKRT